MRKLSVLVIAMVALVFAIAPLMAQAPDGKAIYFHPPIRISDQPQNPAVPSGILPAQFKAAYGFNRIPNQGQGQTIAVIDAYDDPTIEADLAVYQAQFHVDFAMLAARLRSRALSKPGLNQSFPRN